MARSPVEAPGREEAAVHMHRYEEALAAGMTELEARAFADSTVDVGELRRLVALGWPADQIANMLN